VKIALFEAKCGGCGHSFPRPHLGDFSYAEFLFTSEAGTHYAYFGEATDQPVWKVLESALPSTIAERRQAALIQAACAYFADPVEGQHFVIDFVCPECQSRKAEYWGGDRVGEIDIPLASHQGFMGLPAPEQRRRLEAFFRTE